MLPLLFKKKPSSRSSIDTLDQKLVKQMGSRTIPSWTQLKYFSRFLTKSEKIFFNVFLTVAILGLVGSLGVYCSKHLTLVPNEGGEYSEALIGQPKFINPLFASVNEVDQDISSLAYAGLFHYEGTKLMPLIAESYTVSTDTKSFDIKLRHDVRFADGKPLTSSDVVYTFDLIQNPEVASSLLSSFQGVKVETRGDYEVLFTLKDAYSPFLNSLTVGILPEHIWNSYSPSGLRLAATNLQPMGAGPWQFSKMLKDTTGRVDSMTLSRNENYFGKKPFFKTVRFKFFDEVLSALEAVRSQSVDTLSFAPHEHNLKLNNNSIGFYSLQLPQYTALFLNQSNEPALKNLDVRQALSESTDRQQIITHALDGYGVVVDSPVLLDATGDGTAKNPDLDVANALLDKNYVRIEPEEYYKLRLDELKKLDKTVTSSTTTVPIDSTLEMALQSSVRQEMDPEQTFYRRDKNNNILELTITTGDTDEYSRVANELAKMWEKIGIKTRVETISVNRLIRDKIKNRSYSILLYSEIVGGDPDPYAFWHSSQIDSGWNLAGFSDRTADQLLEDARGTADDNARNDLYAKFDKILAAQLPAIFLYTPLQTMAVNKEVREVSNQVISTPFDRFNDLSSWYTKRKLKWK